MITALHCRNRRSLNGRWRAVVDPYEAGYYSFHGEPWELGWFRNLPLRTGFAEYDFDRGDLLHVPGDWNSQDPRLFFYEGTVWYKRDFDWQPEAGTRSFLHFGAANYETKVYVNGQKVGEHEGGFTPFAFEVTDVLEPGNNFVFAKVDNKRLPDGVPTTQTDWWNYGGLTRDVDLLTLPETFIEDLALRLDRDGHLRGHVQLNGSAATQTITVRIPEIEFEISADGDADGRAKIDVPAPALELWSPTEPRLYEVDVAIDGHSLRERMGFRTIETKGCDILLNGKEIFLRGISIHEEAPIREGRAWSEEDARTLLGWAQELGCNFVRLAHYPHNEHMARIADELGLLVWAEIPVYWGISWERPETLELAKHQLGAVIQRDRNRPSVILWSLANETPQSEARLEFLGSLAKEARELDPSRLLSAALMARAPKDKDRTMVLDDPLAQHLDVMGCNEYLGWYYGDPGEVGEWRWESPYDKPLIMSEFGAGALGGHHGERETVFTEENQAWVYEGQVEMFREIPFLRGLSPWILKDFRSPRRVLPDIQDYWNRKGLISEQGRRKLAFRVLQRYYAELAAAEDTP